MSVDLIFNKPAPAGPPNVLVFGDDGSTQVTTLYGDLAFPSPTFSSAVESVRPPDTEVSFDLAFPAVTFSSAMTGASATSRPTVNQHSSSWQKAVQTETGLSTSHQDAVPQPAAVIGRWQEAAPLSSATTVPDTDALRTANSPQRIRYQQALKTGKAPIPFGSQDALRGARLTRALRYQEAIRLPTPGYRDRWQDGDRTQRRRYADGWQDANPLRRAWLDRAGRANALNVGRQTRHQFAMKPPPGTSGGGITPPVDDPCYVPNTILVFKDEAYSPNTTIIFTCERHDDPNPQPGETIIIPVRKVYVVLNTSSLYRVDGNVFLPTFSMSMSLDTDSWTWSFSATLPRTAYGDVKHASDGTPVEVECKVNGVPYRFKVTKISADRGFASNNIRIDGRGVSDELDGPTAPIMNFGGYGSMGAQQLMDEVLKFNGVSLGWTVDWQLIDWLVPADTWAKQGTYIEAINEIAAAAGGYVQPTPSGKTLRVLPRFPSMPKDWTLDMADYELPDSIAVRESIDWVEKPRYNRVYVAGQKNGVLADVKITGTDGGLVAPQVVDALITHQDAGRQRAISVLGNTGRIATYGLRTAVGIKDDDDNEIGIITPGKWIRYIENGVPKIGITRSVSVEIGTPEIMQTVGVEFHESV